MPGSVRGFVHGSVHGFHGFVHGLHGSEHGLHGFVHGSFTGPYTASRAVHGSCTGLCTASRAAHGSCTGLCTASHAVHGSEHGLHGSYTGLARVLHGSYTGLARVLQNPFFFRVLGAASTRLFFPFGFFEAASTRLLFSGVATQVLAGEDLCEVGGWGRGSFLEPPSSRDRRSINHTGVWKCPGWAQEKLRRALAPLKWQGVRGVCTDPRSVGV